MYLVAQVIAPLLILLTATLWTVVDFWIHPVRDLENLPWPVRRSVQEGLLTIVVWVITSTLYWQAFRWSMLYKGIGVGFAWALVTLYWSTLLRQRAIDKANRHRSW